MDSSMSFTISWNFAQLMAIDSVMPSNQLILWHLFSSCPQSFPAWGSFPVSRLFASGDRGTGASASASSLSNEYSGLISYRIDWFGLLAVQGTMKSLLQHHSSKTSIIQRWIAGQLWEEVEPCPDHIFLRVRSNPGPHMSIKTVWRSKGVMLTKARLLIDLFGRSHFG